eukprot:357482-Chlamydomonas_euryale.AAC.3
MAARVRTNKSLPWVRVSHLASLRHMRVLSHFQQRAANTLIIIINTRCAGAGERACAGQRATL